jgi:hypothetical protein
MVEALSEGSSTMRASEVERASAKVEWAVREEAVDLTCREVNEPQRE